jgi:hypothetical protein
MNHIDLYAQKIKAAHFQPHSYEWVKKRNVAMYIIWKFNGLSYTSASYYFGAKDVRDFSVRQEKSKYYTLFLEEYFKTTYEWLKLYLK